MLKKVIKAMKDFVKICNYFLEKLFPYSDAIDLKPAPVQSQGNAQYHLDDSYRMGYDSFSNGISFQNCPFCETSHVEQWKHGWSDAHQEYYASCFRD